MAGDPGDAIELGGNGGGGVQVDIHRDHDFLLPGWIKGMIGDGEADISVFEFFVQLGFSAVKVSQGRSLIGLFMDTFDKGEIAASEVIFKLPDGAEDAGVGNGFLAVFVNLNGGMAAHLDAGAVEPVAAIADIIGVVSNIKDRQFAVAGNVFCFPGNARAPGQP